MIYKRLNICILIISISSLLLSSCQHENHHEYSGTNHNLQAVVWQQNAAEYKALCFQAFNLASYRIKGITGSENDSLKYAIITDIDETVLDNSNYNARLIRDEADYNRESWDNWVNEEEAQLIPGAFEFFNSAAENGIEIFYISNRYESTLGPTISNLKKWNLPNADSSHVFLKTESSAKQSRRDKVLKDYTVLLYLGDNLADFSELFDDKSKAERNAISQDLRNEFGNKFIIFPNTMYGDWESDGIFNRNYDWTNAQKDSIRKSNLRY